FPPVQPDSAFRALIRPYQERSGPASLESQGQPSARGESAEATDWPGIPSAGGLRDTQQAMPDESTTPDLIDSFRRGVEAFNRRDLDATARTYAPDVVWDGTGRGIGRFDGRAAFRAFLK